MTKQHRYLVTYHIRGNPKHKKEVYINAKSSIEAANVVKRQYAFVVDKTQIVY